MMAPDAKMAEASLNASDWDEEIREDYKRRGRR
jgi:hypothetical protein